MKKLTVLAIAGLPLMAVAASNNLPGPVSPDPGTIGAAQSRILTPAPTPAKAPSAFPPLPIARVSDAALSAAPPAAEPPATLYFSNPELKLTPQEREALAIAKKWKAGNSTQGIKPVAGADGTVRYLYGATQPSIICAVLQVC
ncbi:MAG: hypothetical protein ABIT23_11820, partial [Nitrosospira sp.]